MLTRIMLSMALALPVTAHACVIAQTDEQTLNIIIADKDCMQAKGTKKVLAATLKDVIRQMNESAARPGRPTAPGRTAAAEKVYAFSDLRVQAQHLAGQASNQYYGERR